MNVVSNTDVRGVQTSVRFNALNSFEFFANTVLSSRLSEDLCSCVQDVIEDREDFVFKTNVPRTLMTTLHAWLVAKGYGVLSPMPAIEHEILAWLELTAQNPEVGDAVALSMHDGGGVSLQWL